MTREARAILSLLEGFSDNAQREVIRGLWKRFQDMIDEEEDRLLAAEAEKRYKRWLKSGKKTVSAAAVRAELEREGVLRAI